MSRQKLKKRTPTDIAIVSLCVAVLALSINAFLTQKAEGNRNTRQAAFEMIMQLGELQNITNQVHYNSMDKDTALINGWGHIALIEDLSILLSVSIQEKTTELTVVWQAHHQRLGMDNNSETAISQSITEVRASLKELLKEL